MQRCGTWWGECKADNIPRDNVGANDYSPPQFTDDVVVTLTHRFLEPPYRLDVLVGAAEAGAHGVD